MGALFSVIRKEGTRGQAWYMDLLCLAKGGKEILSKATIDKGYLG